MTLSSYTPSPQKTAAQLYIIENYRWFLIQIIQSSMFSWGFAVFHGDFMGFCRFSWGFHGVFSHFVHRLSHIGSPLHQSAHAVHVVVGRRHVQRRAALGVRRVHLDAVGVEEFHQVLRQFEGGKVRAFRRKAGIILHHMNFYISIYDYMCDDSLLSWFSMFVIMDFFLE